MWRAILAKASAATVLCWLGIAGIVNASESPRELKRDADLYLVPVGTVPPIVMNALARRYRDLAQLDVEVVGQLPVPDEIVNPQRKQLIAEKTNGLMERVLGFELYKPGALVVGVTPWDMYIAGSGWRYAYAYGQGRYALVSAARMADAESEESRWSPRLVSRVEKMLDKRIALQFFGLGKPGYLPPVLAAPVLGPDDLDRLDGKALERLLAEASRLEGRSPVTENARANTNESATQTGWLALFLIVGTVFVGLGLTIWASHRKEVNTLNSWKAYAERHGWHFLEQPRKWYSLWNFEIRGELNGVPATARWMQKGSGKAIRYFTELFLEHPTAEQVHISPRMLFSGLLADRLKTGHALYDCRFLVQTRNKAWRPSAAWMRLHLQLPVTLEANQTGLSLIHNSRATEPEFQQMLELAQTWSNNQGDPEPALRDTLQMRLAVTTCGLKKLAQPLFWVATVLTMALWVTVSGTESTNLPWEMAWHWLAPLFAVLSLGALVFLARGRRHIVDGIGTLIVAAGLAFWLWAMLGVWLLGWNNTTGDTQPRLAMGPVTQLHETSGKGGPKYTLGFRDITEHREVIFNVNHETYLNARVGDPVAFDVRKGGLGIYHNPNSASNALRTWLSRLGLVADDASK
jgi:predicted Zn-dependent protease